ncbi:hypothetical protein D6D04_09815 [Aureobasidium pullulans]|nr:hypothetical protein D6D04_09815 [Aureobasidium pullulans]
MKAVELTSDARFVVLWSDRQVVVYSLSSAVREQLLDYSLTADPQRRINSITTFGSTLAVTVGAPRSDEVRERTLISSVVQTHANYVHQIKFFRINNRTSSQHKRKAHGTLILGETDHFRRVLLGINDTVVLIYSNCLRIGTLRDDLQDSLANLKTVHLKSDTEHFFQPSISLNGHRLVVCSRDNKVSQVENWHYIDLSVPREALEDLILPNAMPPPDLQGSTSPAFMIPLQNTVGTYYSTGTFALFEGIEHGCKLPKNLACAAATGSGHEFPESQYLVYVTQNQRLVMPKTEIWYVEIQRYGAGGRVRSTSPNRLLALSGKLKQPSLGFNWRAGRSGVSNCQV